MKKIKLTANVLFSGIGCQERGIKNTNLFDLKVVNTVDINKEAILSYAAIHCGLTIDLINSYEGYPSKEEMAKQLTKINLGFEPEKNKYYDWFKIAHKKSNDINKYWLANKLSHNLGDISKVEKLTYADLWTCSFPCTDISAAGSMKGLSPDSKTQSSLLWENIRLLKQAKNEGVAPKYIMFENVKNLVSKKFKSDFNNLLEVLNEIGYNSYWQVINAKDCGIPQNRERVFIICIRKDLDTFNFQFPKSFDNGVRLKDILEEKVDKKYYIENENALHLIQELETIGKIERDEHIKHCIRRLTPTECWRLMGLTEEDIKKAKAVGVGDTQLYRQAGNGIVTNCIELLGEHLYQSQYNGSYKCTDERITNITDDTNHIIILGNIYPSKGQNGNIIDKCGISTTISSGTGAKGNGIGSNNAPKIIDDTYKNREIRIYDKYSPALRNKRQGLKVVECKNK